MPNKYAQNMVTAGAFQMNSIKKTRKMVRVKISRGWITTKRFKCIEVDFENGIQN